MTAKIVRSQSWGKFHIPTDATLTAGMCGAMPTSVGAFSHRGDRAEFERVAPHLICKHCRNKEAAR